MRLTFEGLKATVEVPDCPDFAAALKAGAVDWPFRQVDDEAEPAARITGSGSSLLVHYPDEEPLPVTPVGAACSLMVSLAEALVTENPDRLCFHGGAALFGGRLAIFPGRSRAGKSTMIARLAAGGHTVFGDDILPLDESEDAPHDRDEHRRAGERLVEGREPPIVSAVQRVEASVLKVGAVRKSFDFSLSCAESTVAPTAIAPAVTHMLIERQGVPLGGEVIPVRWPFERHDKSGQKGEALRANGMDCAVGGVDLRSVGHRVRHDHGLLRAT
mgnify:CR=1 FL=1